MVAKPVEVADNDFLGHVLNSSSADYRMLHLFCSKSNRHFLYIMDTPDIIFLDMLSPLTLQ